jgi:hypothetical protein
MPCDFENIFNLFSGTLELYKGSSMVEYSIESNIEDLLDEKGNSRTLKFSQYSEQCLDSHGIHFEAVSQKYKELKNNGNADGTFDLLEFDPSIVSNGSRDITLEGKSENQSVVLSGTSNVDLSEIPAQSITARNKATDRVRTMVRSNTAVLIIGSENIKIDSLYVMYNVDINGSGNLIYSDDPSKINHSHSGSGKLI